MVVVTAGAVVGNVVGPGDVLVFSESFGTARGVQMFTYLARNISAVVPSTGPTAGGFLATISGQYFQWNTEAVNVYIGSVPALVLNTTTNQVIVTVPAGTGVRLAVSVRSSILGTIDALSMFSYTPELVLSGTSEALKGASFYFQVSLNAPLQQTVTADVTFAPAGWLRSAASRTITLTPDVAVQQVSFDLVSDSLVRGNTTCVVHALTTSVDALVNGVSGTHSLLCVETTGPQLLVDYGTYSNTSSVDAVLAAMGSSGSFGIRLNSSPLSAVVVFATCTSGLVCQNALVFTAANWNATAELAISAPYNHFTTFLQSFVQMQVQSTAPGFDDSLSRNVSVLVLNVDGVVPAVLLTPAVQQSVVERSPGTKMLAVVLLASLPPTTCMFVSNDSARIVAVPAQRILSASDYLRPQAVDILPVQTDYSLVDAPVTVTLVADANSANTSHVVAFKRVTLPGIEVFAPAIIVSEVGTSVVVTVRLRSRPTSDVTVSVTGSDASVALSVAQLWFDGASSTDWHTWRNVTVSGRRHGDANNRTCELVFQCHAQTQDPMYAGLQTSVQVVNMFALWPVLVSAQPTVLPQLGINVTVLAYNLTEAVRVFVADLAISNVTVSPTMSLSGEQAQLMRFQAPLLARTGYVRLQVINSNGATVDADGLLYYSADCPYVGMFGVGVACAFCPTGAVCPGGNRMWAAAGYWTDSETRGAVQACPQASHCLGGQPSLCASGYQGPLCSDCQPQFYAAGVGCLPCISVNVQALLLALQVSMIVAFAVCVLLLPHDQMAHIQFGFQVFRMVWVASLDSFTAFPPWLQPLLNVLAFFLGDFSFSQPGCFGLSSYTQVFGINLGATFLADLLFVLLSCLKLLHVHFLMRRDGADTATEKRAARMLSADRIARGLVTMLQYEYDVLVTMSFKALLCANVPGGFVLMADTALRCFAGVHTVIFTVAIIVLLAEAVLFPLLMLWTGYCVHQLDACVNQDSCLNVVLHAMGATVIDEFRPIMALYGAASLLSVCENQLLAASCKH
eukprot:TRINITY_DN3879_c0_g1_i1.p1 TRINITY_DN3879_c0_g1~~TRINITY_DN3879_c0_g1_i1.p1  ORF type:complete len:1021 (-),score=232.67 TRINITY_DN3879_c0_g1_i1:711-3773(-)